MNRFVLAASAGLAIAACSDTIVVGDLQEVSSLKAIPNPNLDILFVVDNSGSMADQQVALANNFPLMMDVLGQLDGGLPNLHIGVVTSDMGTSGSSSTTPAAPVGVIGQGGCTGFGDDGALQHANAPSLTDAFISDVSDGSGGRRRNYTGELREVFSQIAVVGDQGCGFEQHLTAMRRGLENPANAGFVRPGANLAVVIIADEDDCSVLDPSFFAEAAMGTLTSFSCTRHGVHCAPDMESIGTKTDCAPQSDSTLIDNVQPFVDGLVALKGDPRYVMVAGIIGDPGKVAVEPGDPPDIGPILAPACVFAGASGPESADPGVRLSAFLDAFPGRSQLTSICSADLSAPLSAIGATAKRLVGDPCVDTSLLVDASTAPGVQPACEVVDVRDSAPDAPTTLPACSSGASDCYELLSDPVACPATEDHMRVSFHRTAVTDDTWTSVRCQLR